MLCRTVCLLAIIQIAIGAFTEKPVDFSQHQVISVLPKKLKDLEVLEKIKDEFNIDYWNRLAHDLRPVLTHISPEQSDFLLALNNSNIKYEIKANNLQKLIDGEKEQNQRNRMVFSLKGFDYENSYHSYEEIVSELHTMNSRSSKASYKSIGNSYQGRAIPSITITNAGGSAKRTIFLECGIHAREWISPATCLWMANTLLTDPKNNELLDKFEFIIVPVLNPDGYVYTKTDRMWRKTRSPQAGGCVGADPNRNWDANFCRSGASRSPCNDAYCGPKPFSEIETRHMAELVKTKIGNIAAYFAIHSFSQLWMYPYGYAKSYTSNRASLESLSTKAVNAIKNVNGLVFTKGSIADVIYVASGSSTDWAYDACGVKNAFAIELRDRGQYGFMLPQSQIKAAAMEIWAGIRAVCMAI